MSLTPQVPTPTLNTNIASGLSIGSGGQIQGGMVNPPAATQASLLLGNAPTPSPTGAIKPTSTGGINFAGLNQNTATAPAVIGSTASRTYQTPNGGTLNLAADGSVSNFAPAPNYSISTSGSFPSSALTTNTSMGDVTKQRNQYEDALQALATAKGYSPDYIKALQAYQSAQLAQQQQTSSYYTDPNYTQGFSTGQAAVLNNRATAVNTLATTQAQNALQLQETIRQGNIGATTALAQGYAPQSVAPGSSLVNPATGAETYSGLGGYQAVQGIQNTNSLASEFPDAGINPATDSYTVAQAKAAASPSFQSRNLQQINLPGGGISFINKNQIATNPSTGQTAIVTPAQGAQAEALKGAIDDSTKGLTQVQSALTTADQNFPLLLQTMKADGINDYNSPLANQLQQKVQNGFTGALAPYNALVTSLQSTYSQIVARGGSVDDKTRSAAEGLVNGKLSYNDLSALYQTLKKESANVVSGYTTQIQNNTQQLNSLYNTAQPVSSLGGTSAPAGGYISPAQATW
jgi:hypothetical protein